MLLLFSFNTLTFFFICVCAQQILFEEFQGKRIFGIKYITESIEQDKPLPKTEGSDGFVLLSRCLEGVLVSCDEGVFQTMGQELSQCVRLMGGVFLPHLLQCQRLQAGSLPHTDVVHPVSELVHEFKESYFVCEHSLVKEYESALSMFTEIVKSSWVIDCFGSLEKLPVCPLYVLPPLTGCLISVTGFTIEARQYIQQIVVSLGGSFSPEFSSNCTHLIAYVTYKICSCVRVTYDNLFLYD